MDEKTFAAGIENSPYYRTVQELAAAEGAQVLPICAALEEEISSLDEEEKQIFLQDIGLEASGLDRMVSCLLYPAQPDQLSYCG